jgi:hypothetical protein
MESEDTPRWLLLSSGSLQMIFVEKQSLNLPIGVIFCFSDVSGCFWLQPAECDHCGFFSSILYFC